MKVAEALSGVVGRPVIDQTGLNESYAMELTWPEAMDGAGSRSIFAAVREQLGLRLEPAKGLLVSYIIEHAERPSEN
jgi:uncharacterized protein (TIGR03435 family)